MDRSTWQQCTNCKCLINPALAMCSCGYRPPQQQYARTVNPNKRIYHDPPWTSFRAWLIQEYGKEFAEQHLFCKDYTQEEAMVFMRRRGFGHVADLIETT